VSVLRPNPDAAESRETSCSPLRPPKRTPTRSFFMRFQSGRARPLSPILGVRDRVQFVSCEVDGMRSNDCSTPFPGQRVSEGLDLSGDVYEQNARRRSENSSFAMRRAGYSLLASADNVPGICDTTCSHRSARATAQYHSVNSVRSVADSLATVLSSFWNSPSPIKSTLT